MGFLTEELLLMSSTEGFIDISFPETNSSGPVKNTTARYKDTIQSYYLPVFSPRL
jgi:hypothetical protein